MFRAGKRFDLQRDPFQSHGTDWGWEIASLPCTWRQLHAISDGRVQGGCVAPVQREGWSEEELWWNGRGWRNDDQGSYHGNLEVRRQTRQWIVSVCFTTWSWDQVFHVHNFRLKYCSTHCFIAPFEAQICLYIIKSWQLIYGENIGSVTYIIFTILCHKLSPTHCVAICNKGRPDHPQHKNSLILAAKFPSIWANRVELITGQHQKLQIVWNIWKTIENVSVLEGRQLLGNCTNASVIALL